jgi:hypothetical protein
MAMEDPTTLVSQALTPTGGNSSDYQENTSLMSRTIKHSMLKVAETMKVKLFGSATFNIECFIVLDINEVFS